MLSSVQTGKFLAQVFLWRKFSCTRKLVQENLRKFHVHTTQVSCSRKWLYPLEKSYLQSIVQSAAEFHDRNLPEIEHVLSVPVSGASFLYQKNDSRNPVHTGKFSVARNLRQKLASLNAAFDPEMFFSAVLYGVVIVRLTIKRS